MEWIRVNILYWVWLWFSVMKWWIPARLTGRTKRGFGYFFWGLHQQMIDETKAMAQQLKRQGRIYEKVGEDGQVRYYPTPKRKDE